MTFKKAILVSIITKYSIEKITIGSDCGSDVESNVDVPGKV